MNAKIQESKKVRTIRRIVKMYFYAALAGSFSHIVASAYIMGAEKWYEAFATPLLIDGLAVIGMIMRSDGPDGFSKRTNKIGFILQCVMGAFSLTMNVVAGLGQSFFGVAFGVALVACFILAEWLKDNLESSEVDVQAEKDRKAKEQAAADALAAAELVRQAEEAAKAAAAADAWKALCSHPTRCSSEVQCATKTKASKTRKRTERTKKAQERVLESMIAG